MRANRRRREARIAAPTLRLALLALCVLCGIFLGQALVKTVPYETGRELRDYLAAYLQLEESSVQGAVFAAALLYLPELLFAFLLGFTAAGTVLLPVTAVIFGCRLSFSVCCLTAALGKTGIWAALAAAGIRCAVTLPCFFLMAVPALGASAARAASSFGRGRRIRPDRSLWLRFLILFAAAAAGMCVDLLVSPHLLGRVLEYLLS